MNKSNILFWDIEVTPMIVTSWSLFKPFLSYENVLQDWYMICAAWKWQGSNKINSVSLLNDKFRFKEDHTDDYYVIERLHEVLSKADAVVGHNSDKFDLKKFNTRAVYHGFTPIPSLIQIDTLKIAKKKFKFDSNRLDALGEYLGVGRKIKTEYKLWLDCLDGNMAAIRQMVTYNRQDVELLEAIYDILSPYDVAKLNQNLFHEGVVCPHCGSHSWHREGHRYTRSGRYQQIQCNACGHWGSFKTSDVNVEVK